VIGSRLVAAVEKHAAGRPQNDDIALVCFGRVIPGQGGEPGVPAPIRPATTKIMKRRK
jgi:hypothetical protein